MVQILLQFNQNLQNEHINYSINHKVKWITLILNVFYVPESIQSSTDQDYSDKTAAGPRRSGSDGKHHCRNVSSSYKASSAQWCFQL